jgi:tRNA threonylcarbamoyladenosine biosynthesis protein TsaB
MACLLTIETSTRICSLSLSLNGLPIFNRINKEGISHATQLGIFAHEAVEFARQNSFKIDAVAVSSGPGSYTGLRIGVSEAKGLCYGFGIPLIAIPSLKILTSALFLAHPNQFSLHDLFCPMIDARRMEVYSALYDQNLNEIQPVQAEIIDEDSYEEQLKKHRIIFFGDGSNKCRNEIFSTNAIFVDAIVPTAEAMIPLAEKAYAKKEFVDVAYFEPFYLKEFQATVAKNKIIPFTP